jgi:hypothetical protein
LSLLDSVTLLSIMFCNILSLYSPLNVRHPNKATDKVILLYIVIIIMKLSLVYEVCELDENRSCNFLTAVHPDGHIRYAMLTDV